MSRKPKVKSVSELLKSAKRYNPPADFGLTDEQVEERKAEGLVNFDAGIQTKSYTKIFSDNIITLFNIVNLILAISVIAVGEYKNAVFMGVVICNTAIGIIQEIRAKRVVDKLSFISQSSAIVIRNGNEQKIPVCEIVPDDIIKFTNGSQICTDCIVISGQCDINESFVTGESDPISKHPGDILLAGSFAVAGSCIARADKIADANYISGISKGAKYIKKDNGQIISGLKKIIKIMSCIILPLGIAIFLKSYLSSHIISTSVTDTTAALIGLIPQGLVLLTSSALALGVIKLSGKKVLVRDIYSIETLARTDTLCLDKTGTITEGKMEVSDFISIKGDEQLNEKILRSLVYATGDNNATAQAIKEKFGEGDLLNAVSIFPFSSKTKRSGAVFEDGSCYVLGAYEFCTDTRDEGFAEVIESYMKEYRTLTLCKCEKFNLTAPVNSHPVAILLLRDKIKPNADKIISYFYSQNVDIKIISGDSALTVSSVAKEVGIKNWDKYIDCSLLKEGDDLKKIAKENSVFGRVTPEIKKELVKALKSDNRTVAMTGDGVNDVPALKEADCSIAMADGSDAARNVSNMVLLDSSFNPLPDVIDEGRRSVNNIQKSASLFLVKTFYSAILAVLFLVLPHMRYPFEPIQMTLIGFVGIGFPSAVLAFLPNKERISGSFFANVIIKALPGASVIALSLSLLTAAEKIFGLTYAEFSTAAVMLTGFTAICILAFVCRPANKLQIALIAAVATVFISALIFGHDFFSLTALSFKDYILVAVLEIFSFGLLYILQKFERKFTERKKKSAE